MGDLSPFSSFPPSFPLSLCLLTKWNKQQKTTWGQNGCVSPWFKNKTVFQAYCLCWIYGTHTGTRVSIKIDDSADSERPQCFFHCLTKSRWFSDLRTTIDSIYWARSLLLETPGLNPPGTSSPGELYLWVSSKPDNDQRPLTLVKQTSLCYLRFVLEIIPFVFPKEIHLFFPSEPFLFFSLPLD